jgi:hypothetical protein
MFPTRPRPPSPLRRFAEACRRRRGVLCTPEGPIRYATYIFWTLLALVYFGVFPYNSGINNPNENTRIYTTVALVEHHTWRIDDEVKRFGATNDTALVDGHRYACKAPGMSLLGAPVYWLFAAIGRHVVDAGNAPAWLRATTLVLRLVVVQLPCFLFLVWFWSWLRARCADPVLVLIATAGLAIGTNYLAYSLSFVSHALTAALAFIAFAFICAGQRPFLVGNLIGLITVLEYHGIFTSLVLAVHALWVFRQRRALAWLFGGIAIHAFVLLGFQKAAFGSAWRTPFQYLEDRHLLENHRRGFLGLGLPRLDALVPLCLNRTIGLFGTSPFSWLAVLAPIVAWRRPAVRWAAVMFFVLPVAVSGLASWSGGWSIGPRYLVTIAPFAAFLIAMGLEALGDRGAWQRAVARGLGGGLVVASGVIVGVLSLLVNNLPPTIENPLVQVTIPFLRAGFVPYSAVDLFGVASPGWFYLFVAALAVLGGMAAFAAPRGHWSRWPAVAIAIAIALAPVARAHGSYYCPYALKRMSEIWEPSGRDRIASLRAEAAENPCKWWRAGALEGGVCWLGAEADQQRAIEAGCRPPAAR